MKILLKNLCMGLYFSMHLAHRNYILITLKTTHFQFQESQKFHQVLKSAPFFLSKEQNPRNISLTFLLLVFTKRITVYQYIKCWMFLYAYNAGCSFTHITEIFYYVTFFDETRINFVIYKLITRKAALQILMDFNSSLALISYKIPFL